MKQNKFMFVLFVALAFSLFFIAGASAIDIGWCANLTSADTYVLNTSVSSSGTCFNTWADNVTLDCNGFTINYSSASVGYGVYSNSTNTTVKNCVINLTDPLNSNSRGIYFNGVSASNGTIYNNMIKTASSSINNYAIYLELSSFNNVSSNTVIDNIIGFYLYKGANNSLVNNTANNNYYGFALSESSNNSLVNNTAIDNIRGFDFVASNNLFTGNLVTTSVFNGQGVYLTDSTYNVFLSNTISTTGSDPEAYAIGFLNSTANIFNNNFLNALGTGVPDIYVEYFGINNFTNCTFNKSDTFFAGATDYINVFWYVDAYVNYSNSTSFSGANVSAWNVNNILNNWSLTNVTGNTPRLTLREYMQNATAMYFDTNYTFYGNKTNYTGDIKYVNLTENKVGANRVFLTLTSEGGDTTNPVAVQGTNPVDNYNSSSSSLTFDMKCYDNIAVSSIQIYANWSGSYVSVYSNYSYTNNTWINITIASIPDINNSKWAIYCNDTSNLLNNTLNRTLNMIIPTVASNVNVTLVTPINNYNSSNSTISFNCTANSTSNISNISLYGNWSGGWHNNYTNVSWCYQETANVSTSCGGLSTGNYTLGGYWQIVIDLPHNLYDGDWSTRSMALYENYSYLLINYTKPANSLSSSVWQVKSDTGYTTETVNYTLLQSCWDYNSTTILLKAASNRTDVWNNSVRLSCFNSTGWQTLLFANVEFENNLLIYEEAMWWDIPQTNNTYLEENLTINDGYYLWNCYACDIDNNCSFANSNYTFSVDTTPPTLNINYPSNNSYFNYAPYINGTCNDTNLNYIYTNATEYSALDGTSPFNFTNLSALSNGIYLIKVSCNDSANNINSSLVNFTYDNIYPNINYSSPTPANNTIQTSSANLIVNVTSTDTNPSFAWMTLSNLTDNANQILTNISNQTWTNNTNISFSIYALNNGNYSYNITACDLAGNCNTTENYYINISYLNVSVHINYPSDGGSVTYSSYPQSINFTYLITYTGTLNCTFNLTNCGVSDLETQTLNCSAGTQNITLQTSYSSCLLSIAAYNYADLKNASHFVTFDAVSSTPAPPGGGGGGVTPPGNVTWTMTTEQGTGKYEFSMGYGRSRTRNIVFYNTGTDKRTISLSCSGDLCKYMVFDKTSIELPAGLEIATSIPFTITIPENETAKDMTANIIGLDDLGLQNILTIQVGLGQANVFLDILNNFPNSKKVGNSNIPYWIIFLVALVSIFFLSWLILRKLLLGIFISVLISIVGAFIFMIFV